MKARWVFLYISSANGDADFHFILIGVHLITGQSKMYVIINITFSEDTLQLLTHTDSRRMIIIYYRDQLIWRTYSISFMAYEMIPTGLDSVLYV